MIALWVLIFCRRRPTPLPASRNTGSGCTRQDRSVKRSFNPNGRWFTILVTCTRQLRIAFKQPDDFLDRWVRRPICREDYADLIAESPAAGFLAKADLSAIAVRRILGAD